MIVVQDQKMFDSISPKVSKGRSKEGKYVWNFYKENAEKIQKLVRENFIRFLEFVLLQ